MQVRAKFFVPALSVLLTFILGISSVRADNLNDAIEAYLNDDYKKAMVLLNNEIRENPENYEAYKWLGKTYEAMFDIEKAVKAYQSYENIKREVIAKSTISPLSPLAPSASISPIPTVAPIKATPEPTPTPISPTPMPKLDNIKEKIKPVPSVTPSPLPSLAANPKESKIASKAVKTNTELKKPKEEEKKLESKDEGWVLIQVINLSKQDSIKIIPRDSVDLTEVDEDAGDDKEFVLLKCKIKYTEDIVIKNNSEQIYLSDINNKSYKLYAMSTYTFKYNNELQAKKIEALQVAGYYQLSRKDSRDNITFVFKVDKSKPLKSLKVSGYKDIKLSEFNA